MMNNSIISSPFHKPKTTSVFFFSILLLFILLPITLLVGPTNLFTLENQELALEIFYQQRLPQAIVALLVGAALASSGLILQSWFHNPLADPSILGISSGSSLAIALITMGGSFLPLHLLRALAYLAAPLGALLVLIPLLLVAKLSHNKSFILIFGLMISFFSSALVTLLMHFSSAQEIKQYISWSFGNFSSITLDQIPLFIISISLPLIASFFLLPSLNKYQLGKDYAISMGLKFKRFQQMTLILVSLITGMATYYCGPISFLAIAAAQFSRSLLQSSNHKKLLPLTLLFGSNLALFSLFLSNLSTKGALPINAILSLIGVPVVIVTLLKGAKKHD